VVAVAVAPTTSSAQQKPTEVQSMKGFIAERLNKNSGVLTSSENKVKSSVDLKNCPNIKMTASILKNAPNKRRRQDLEPALQSNSREPANKKQSIFCTSFTDNQIESLLHKKSAKALTELENKNFENREIEEMVETLTTSLMEIKNCKVISCRKCNYTSSHQSSHCKIQGHVIRRHEANKRFFKCKNCQQRTITYDLMPSHICRNCKSKNFERVAMWDERKIQIMEKLEIRGEQRPFINK